MAENDLEIYKQRYETFRYLDRLRWQMLQLLIAVGSASALVVRATEAPLEWWFFTIVGAVVMAIGFAMSRISTGIRKNGEVLRHFGEKVGDTGIPDVADPSKSVGFWITNFTIVFGFVLICWGVSLTGTPSY